jgi:hypothetical protein
LGAQIAALDEQLNRKRGHVGHVFIQEQLRVRDDQDGTIVVETISLDES